MAERLVARIRIGRLVCVVVLALLHYVDPAGAATGSCESLPGGVIEVEGTAGSGTQPTGYATLGAAFTAINTGVHTGTIVVDVCGNTTEGTATATLNASGSGAASYTTITISPAGGASRTISGTTTAGQPMVDMSGADNVTFDGLNSGGNSLTIANTTASATSGTSTFRFIGGATGNVITNSNIQGSGTMSVATNGATIFFSTDAVSANGNDNNTISNNNIGPAGANLPTKAILGNGSTTTTAIGNSGIVINNNNIFDYFGAAVTSSGIATNGGCNTWSITNNRFYQTATRTWTTGALHAAINIGNNTATSGAQGFTITGNTVGYASNTQTGTYTLTGSTGKFLGIQFNGITGGTLSNLNSNTVAAVSLTGVTSSGTSTSTPLTAILVANGVANTNSNTVGSQSTTGSLSLSTTTTSTTDVHGIFNFSVDDWTANNNNIGGISVTNLGASGTFLTFGMRANTATAKVFNAATNNVGGTVASSIQLTSTGAASQVVGMSTVNAISTWTSNTVRNLTNNGGTGVTINGSVIGMLLNSTTPSQTVSQNTIFGLSNSSSTLGTTVTGIQFTGGTANLVARNLIYGLTVATNSTASEVNGIRVAGGTTVYRNNMVAVGAGIANAIGTGSTTGGINGILETGGTNSFFHNSVYVGGAPVAGVGPSGAFASTQVTVVRSNRDNIFFNARSNGGATGKNFAVRVAGTAPNPAGLTLDNNVYLANGTGAVFGLFNSADVPNLVAWRTAVGQDPASIEGNPQYNDPTNAIPDLHIHPTNPTPADGNGFDVGVVDDFDGQTRSGLTPVDIGADAGNFVGVDLSPPAITYTPFTNTTLTTNRTLSATLIDATGVATGGLAPRIYYRKNAGSYFSQACSLTGGTINNGTWDCLVNNADMGGVAIADVIRYFVIAQDTAGNVGSSPAAGLVATNVNTVTTPPTTPNTYTIVTAFSGPVNVGTGETFTSLTNPGGVFEAINNSVLTGNVVLNITSTLVGETGTHALNQWAEEGVGGYTLLLKPSGASRDIIGSNAGALIRLNGADRVRIDGSTAASLLENKVGGGNPALRQLTIQNTNTGTSAVVLAVQSGSSGAQNNTLRNVFFIGQDPTTTLAGVALGGAVPGTAGTDNDNNRVENCVVLRTIYGIYSSGQSAANPNTGTVITLNDLANPGPDRVRRVGIVVFYEDGVQITDNAVGEIDTNESADAVGIGVGTQSIDNTLTTSGGVTNALVARNRVGPVFSQSTTGFSAVGIAVAGAPGGTNTIVDNLVSSVRSPATSPDLVAGIFVAGVPGSNTRVLFNSVSLFNDRGAVATQMPSFGLAITGADPTVEGRNNALRNQQTASGGGVDAKSYAIGMVSTTFANLNSNYNDFFTSGAQAGHFRSGSLAAGAGTDYATVGAWGTAVSDDANSLQVDPQFVLLTDPHLTPSSPIATAGTPIAGVTVDFDNDPRSATAPSIGGDEITADLSITKTDGVTTATAGGSVTYTITASNAGPASTTGTVADTFPAVLTCTWTCVGAGGGTCTAAGSGNISDPVTLPAGGSVTYTASCNISAGATGSLSNTATVTGVAGDPNPGNNSATDIDTLTASADLGITKTDGVTTAAPGGSVTYTIVASNAGPSNTTATVADTFPAVLTCTWTCVGAGGGTCTAAGSGNINDAVNLPAGGLVTYTASCTISAAATGSLSNTATVSGVATDPVPGNNSATDIDTLTPSADLGITKTDGVTTATPGGSTTYTITASNPGPSNAPGSTVADTFPASLTCTWTCVGAGGGTCTAAGSGNINDTVNLPSGGSVTYTASCTISPSATGSLTNTATVAAPGGVTDPTPGNNSATDTDTLGASADLSITKTDGVTTATPGGSVTYTITASNPGPSNAPGSTVADTFPASLTCTWTCGGAGGGTCTAAGSGNVNDTVNLPSGGSVTYTASCTVSGSATGTIANTATVAAPAGVTDPNPANNSATDIDTVATAAGANVSGTKTVTTVGPYEVGDAITYSVVLTNAGPGAQADNPGDEFTDVLPAGLALVSASATSGAASTAGNTVTWNGSLAASASVTITINATILPTAAGTTVANQGTIQFDADANGTNESTAPTDDPGVAGAGNPTAVQVAGTAIVGIPTLGEYGQLVLLLLVVGLGLVALRRRRLGAGLAG